MCKGMKSSHASQSNAALCLGESNPHAVTTEPRIQHLQALGTSTSQLSPSNLSGSRDANGSNALGFFYINVGSS